VNMGGRLMSVELRITVEGECTCGTPYAPGEEPPPHWHHLECDWGRIDHPMPRPDRGEIGHLMLITRSYFGELFKHGPRLRQGRIESVDAVPDAPDGEITDDTPLRLYAYIDTPEGRWTWELFDAHWANGKGPDVYIGRWPD